MKMLWRNRNVSALDAALQVFPEVLQIVDVRVAVGIFARSMINRLVAVTRFPQPFVGVQFVTVNRRAIQDVFLNDRLQGFLGDVRDNLGHHLSTALHHAEHNCFVRRSASATAMSATPDVGFINFNIPKQRPFVVNLRDMLADKVAHAPRRLVSHAKLTLQFLRRNAMARRGEQINGVKPQLQRRAAILKRSADSWVDVVAAPLAGVGAFSFDAKPVGFAFALRAGMIRAEAGFKKVLQANFIGRELRQKFADCQAGFNNVFRFRFHALNIRSNRYVCQGDTSVKLYRPANQGATAR